MIILLSGGPRSGKDEFASQLRILLDDDGIMAYSCSIAKLLKRATHNFYAVLNGIVRAPYWNAFEDVKDEPQPFFLGKTPRQAYIDMHERYIKPMHGETFLADTLSANIGEDLSVYSHVIVTDVGNDREAQSFSRVHSQVISATIEREGVEFDNRSLLTNPTLRFRNNGDIDYMVRWIKTEFFGALA